MSVKYPETQEELDAFRDRYFDLIGKAAPIEREIEGMREYISGWTAQAGRIIRLDLVSKHDHALRHWNSPFHDTLTEEECRRQSMVGVKWNCKRGHADSAVAHD